MNCTSADEFSGTFGVLELLKHLRACLNPTTQRVNLDEYIGIFKQLYRFFCLLGSVFGFVASDVRAKVEILEKLRKKSGVNYETLQSMMAYEEQTGLIKASTSSNPSGTRTFLRLHRALNFIGEFLYRLNQIPDEEATGRICRAAYDATLSQYHGWFVRKGAYLAMFTLPKKKQLYEQMCQTGVDRKKVDQMIPQIIDLTQKIYARCEKTYRDRSYQDLP